MHSAFFAAQNAGRGIVFETSLAAFILITIIIGGVAAYMIGRATAKGWKPWTQAVVYVAILGAAVRFLHYGVFLGATFESWRQAKGTLWSPHYYLVDTLILLGFAALGFTIKRRSQIQNQYRQFLQKKQPVRLGTA